MHRSRASSGNHPQLQATGPRHASGRRAARRGSSLAYHLDAVAPLARRVQFHKENSLPGAESELPIAYWDGFGGLSDECMSDVCGRVCRFVFGEVLRTNLKVVVHVVAVVRSDLRHSAIESLDHSSVGGSDQYAACRVRREDKRSTLLHARVCNHASKFAGDIECVEAPSRLGLKLLEGNHRHILTQVRNMGIGRAFDLSEQAFSSMHTHPQ